MLKNNYNFKYLWSGRLISNAGDSIYLVVLSWYMLAQTGSIFWVGIFNAAYFSPNIFSFLLGDIIDRTNKKRLLILLECGQLVAVLGIITNIFIGFNPLIICCFVFFASLFGMNTYTVQDTLIPRIVQKKELEKAQSYMNVGYNIVDNIFNAIVGLLIKNFSIIFLLSISVFSFTLSIFSFNKMKYEEVKEKKESKEENGYKYRDGFVEILKNKTLLTITINLTIVNFFFGGFNVFIVKIAGDMNSPIMLGLLNSSIAIGTLIGATLFTHKVLSKFILGQKLVLCSFFFGIMMVLTSFFVNSNTILLVLLIGAIFLGVTQILTHPIIQSIVPSNKLGKVFSAQYSISVGIMPIGALFFGKLAEFMSSGTFFICIGVAYVFIAVTYLMRRDIFHFSLSA
ncbi:MFS transporter [Peribacillus muralis]|uniref:MFS transporter n=1 Tax=Peribacillus muralis TaxID=264697 RepID=UPI00137B4441|nr:MFS transporter [Peribacillus muralis]MCK1994217.1 MFS transporter [Peribacillus muralis]MCK2014998.1 MFS transporter [Peribacillus muralis]